MALNLSEAVDVATEALTDKFPKGLDGADVEFVAATALDAAWPELNNVFWAIHRHELERLQVKIGRLEKVYGTAKALIAASDSDPLKERLQAALDEYEVHHVVQVA